MIFILHVNIVNNNTRTLLIPENDIQKISEHIINTELDKADYALSVINCTDQDIKDLNSRYRGIDEATDVLTFVSNDQESDFVDDSQPRELGDIFISIDTIHRQCSKWHNTPEKEYLFMLIHGLLHICGWEHEDSINDHEEMFKRQGYYYELFSESITCE